MKIIDLSSEMASQALVFLEENPPMFTARILCYVIRPPDTPFRNGFHANCG